MYIFSTFGSFDMSHLNCTSYMVGGVVELVEENNRGQLAYPGSPGKQLKNGCDSKGVNGGRLLTV